MGCLFKTVPQSWTTSSWIWLNESWTLIFTSYCSLCLPFRCAFWFSYVGGVLVFFLELMLFADFLMVSFGFHALWISERSFLLFLKLSLFVVSFVLYNCTPWFRRTHGSVKKIFFERKSDGGHGCIDSSDTSSLKLYPACWPLLGRWTDKPEKDISMANF